MDKPKGKPPASAFIVRVSIEQHAKLKAAAESEFMPLSTWARRVLLKAAAGKPK